MTVYEFIKKEIITGKYKEGSIFDEQAVCRQLGVSRTPVREAVLKLNEEGYLVVMPRRGTIVSSISYTDIQSLYGLRRILEPEIAGIAARTMESAEASAWRDYLLRQKENHGEPFPAYPLVQEDSGLWDADKAFHLALATATDNKYIIREIEKVMDLSMRIRVLSNVESIERKMCAIDEHIAIVDAVLAKDSEQAKRSMAYHLEKTMEGYAKYGV